MILRFPEFSRDMHRGEEDAVDALLARAFGSPDKAKMVASLRQSGDIAGEVVLPFQGGIVGYYALARMKAPADWLCLAAVAIDPDWQGAGHGRRLIGMLSEWARLSQQSVIASGPAAFFTRAGFAPSPIKGALLAGPSADLPPTTPLYPPAFKAHLCG
ncbi:GNAT family N-acetyltransferase [Roseovarius arcticus]|uniref:GNAT family N-acetyltransferase n=1 Tax=Roseovarius arcticus TaxID=2547404 RepID=UPI001110C6A2|nr:GNAT family N-acetyltransferase [Roseovarius arcticus]